MFYTYAHIKPDGSIFYIGKGLGDRAWSKDNRNIHWKRTVSKYGYSVKLMAYWDTEDNAFDHEKRLIKYLRSTGVKLVNMTNGGEGSGGYKWTEEQKRKYKESNLVNAMQGKNHSEETKEKIRAKATGRKLPEYAKKVISEKMKVRIFSDEHRKNLSLKSSGGNNAMAKRCKVYGIEYECAQDAAKAIGVVKSTVARKCKRGTSSDFIYL